MAISDVVVGNITSLYLGVIATIKVFGLITGHSYSGVSVLVVSTTVVVLMVLVTLSWDLSLKAVTYASSSHVGGVGGSGGTARLGHQCRGGICWHGTVAVESAVSQVRFRLPRHYPDLPNPSSTSLL